MTVRKITSMTMFASLLLLLLNSIVLYIVPEGRVAYWADWGLLGLSKSQWADQHITVGVLFILASGFHLVFNWAAIKAYMKNKARELKVFTGAFNLAILITLLVAVGTYFKVPPMSTVLAISETIKDNGSKKYGEPPYGHAELSSLKLFTKRERLDLEKSKDLLLQAGVQFTDENETIKSISAKNKLTPQQVYEIIVPAKITQAVIAATSGQATTFDSQSFPDHPQSGFGKKTLAEVCVELQLDQTTIVKGLNDKGIPAESSMKIKEIAQEIGKEPMELFEDIRNLVVKE